MTVVGDSAAVARGTLAGARSARRRGRLPGRVRHGARPDGRPEPGGGGRTGRARRRARGTSFRRAHDLSVAARDGAVARLPPATAIEARGLAVERVSGGGTPTAERTHELGVVDELRVGTYIYGDRACIANGSVPLDDCALRVVATVVSRPTRERAIIDAGSKTLTSDLAVGATGLRPARRVPRRGGVCAQRGARLRRCEPLRARSPRSATASRSSPTTPARPRTCTTRSCCTAAARSSKRCRRRRAER